MDYQTRLKARRARVRRRIEIDIVRRLGEWARPQDNKEAATMATTARVKNQVNDELLAEINAIQEWVMPASAALTVAAAAAEPEPEPELTRKDVVQEWLGDDHELAATVLELFEVLDDLGDIC